MSYTLPTFNLTCNLWSYTSGPPNPPRVSPVCNLAWGRRVSTPLSVEDQGYIWQGMTLLLPAHTDVRDGSDGASGGDRAEVPAGSGRYYQVCYVDDIGKGFSNEHRAAVLIKWVGYAWWPVPYP